MSQHIILSELDYCQLWQDANSHSESNLEVCPPQLGKGFKQWYQLRDISLLIHDYWFNQDVTVTLDPLAEGLELGFQLSGHLSGDRFHRSSGESFCGWGCPETYYQQRSRQRRLQVDIHLESSQLLTDLLHTPNLPRLLQHLETNKTEPFHLLGKITPAMQLALEQLLYCPYQGTTQAFYLEESKCLELIALQLEQWRDFEPKKKTISPLKKDDRDRVYEARAILEQNLTHPPSVPELAHMVGLNHCTLKQGFHECLQTTPFRYLRDRRLEQARILLSDSQFNIQQVAKAVGYKSQSRFCNAFKQTFGITPRCYRQNKISV